MTYDYDLFTIGGGSGGVRAARFSAGFGAKVAIAEERWFGGTCVNVGCVPKKLLGYAAHFREDFADAAGFGWTVGPTSFDWPTLIANKDKEIHRLNSIYEGLMARAGVEVFKARATLLDANTVEVEGRRVTARHILVATGGQPVRDTIVGAQHGYLSDDLFFLPALPRRALVIGGGYIAVEFAGILHGLGSEVTVLLRGDRVLRGFDEDVRCFLQGEMEKKGIRFVTGSVVDRIDRDGEARVCHLSNGQVETFDAVFFAIGRQPNVENLGLEAAGVALTQGGAIAVDPQFRTSAPSVFAIGDVTDRVNLTPVALAEGMAVARTLFAGTPTTVSYDDIPTAVFSHPPVGTVGLTEVQARARHGEIDLYRSEFRPLKHTLSGNPERTLMKLVVERAGQRVVGAHMVGLDAPEILQGLAVAIKAGATKQIFDATIGIHPTAAEEFVTLRDKVPEPTTAKAAE